MTRTVFHFRSNTTEEKNSSLNGCWKPVKKLKRLYSGTEMIPFSQFKPLLSYKSHKKGETEGDGRSCLNIAEQYHFEI